MYAASHCESKVSVKMFFAVENSPRSRKPIISIDANSSKNVFNNDWIVFKSKESNNLQIVANIEASRLWKRKRKLPPEWIDLDRITLMCEAVQRKLDSLFPTIDYSGPSNTNNDLYLRWKEDKNVNNAAFSWEDRSPERKVVDLINCSQTSLRTSYVWAKRKRFKSSIHAMREPDLVGDDFAVRKWNPNFIT